ncbi:hypothetical protein HK101_002770 [Irineochytrium annulatum]|nr:hypothetical protein HK101_002770 [Irineochytrium annulatum]
MRLNAFSVRALRANLTADCLVSDSVIAKLREVRITFGSEKCAARPALSIFAVNDLARMAERNQELKFKTEEKGDYSRISATTGGEPVIAGASYLMYDF